ncbi:SSI family serine proteinase inhibitor [Streptomyces sp. NPDC056672]|uniref:SSI family serine proteinase inhibitor n=1 Tax=Streptomyces sp. NPDC056672 TaxID=3345906 RepID=UPI003678786B
MPRRLVLTAAASVAASAAALGALAPAAFAGPSDRAFAVVPASSSPRITPAPLPPLSAPSDRITITVADTGTAAADGTFKLTCGPTGGTHPRARAACDRLAELSGEGRDPFAPVAPGAMCTMQHGGDATARIAGTWRGHRVNAVFNRKNGCEIARWRTLEPVLPGAKL